MLKDNISNIDRYTSLDPVLRSFKRDDMIDLPPTENFVVDRECTTLLFVEKGRCSFSLSWRENENNREVLAVMDTKEGEFVLYLPGEPYTARPQDGAVVKMWRKA